MIVPYRFIFFLYLLVNHKKTKNAMTYMNKDKKTIVIAEKIRYTSIKPLCSRQQEYQKGSSKKKAAGGKARKKRRTKEE